MPSATLPPEELRALRELFGAANISWQEGGDPCSAQVEGVSLRCDRDHVTFLAVSDRNLTSLPESIGQLHKLQILVLSDNRLASLPESMGQLQTLVNLYLDGNQLTSLPDSIGQLQDLLILYLDRNRLVSLPESLFSLQGVRSLYLDGNQLSSLPESIGQLHKLRILGLSDNRLAALPESFGQLQELSTLYLDFNQLSSLPDSIGQLQELSELFLDDNQLTSLPDSLGQLHELHFLKAARNRLTSLPESLGLARNLRTLDLRNNFIRQLPLNLVNLPYLAVVQLQSNRLQSNLLDFCGNKPRLNTLFLHDNALKGPIPLCLKNLSSLEVLTLHRNALSGSLPGALALPPRLTLLTLHENRLSGSIPEDFAELSRLSFFSAYSNDLEGSIPPLKLKNDCVDDMSFVKGHIIECHPGFYQVDCEDADYRQHCPRSCGLCKTSSSRGPVFLVHKNRLSCSLPQQMTQWPEEMRAISLIGNKLGDGHPNLPSWIHTDERQPFLYVSNSRTSRIFKKTMLLATLFILSILFLRLRTGLNLSIEAGTPLVHQAHTFLLQLSIPLSAVGVVLFGLYYMCATYYVCSDWFSSSTLSNFSKDGNAVAEWAVVMMWTLWIAVGAFFLRKAPAPRPERNHMSLHLDLRERFQKVIYCFFWLCIVAILSSPSVFYSVSNSLPSNNTLSLSPWWQQVMHYQAALIMVLVDMLIMPTAVAKFSARTGLRRSMLFMAGRLVMMWLAATLTTLYLSPHCMNGWVFAWKVCEEGTEEYENFNITFGDTQLLEPKADLCSASSGLWSDGKCMRSLVDTMAPLLVSKTITRAFLQPIITLVKWQLSHHQGGQLYMRRYLLYGDPICTSSSLEEGQQASLLVTFAEVALLWGPFVPVLLPAVILATCTNMLTCRIGHGHFAVEHKSVDANPVGMSRRYLHGTLSVALCFQNWFAWTSKMHGRWLLLITSCFFAMEVLALGIRSSNAKWRVMVEMSACAGEAS